jgi:two-component system, NtrC family, sensor kinase
MSIAKTYAAPLRAGSATAMAGLLNLQKAQRREAAISIACVSICAILIAALTAWQLSRTYREALAVGHVRASNLSLVLEEQTRRTVQALDFTLSLVGRDLERAPQTPSHDPDFTAKMRDQLLTLPYARALFVVGADGFIIQDSDVGTPDVSLADRDYFRAQAIDPKAGLYIGEPLKSRSTQIGSPWFLSVSRRINLPDGTFYGVAVAALQPKYFAQFYSKIDIGGDGVVALIHASALVIARYPEHENGEGVSLSGQKLFTTELKRGNSGTYTDISKVDGVERVYAYRTVSPFPLIVAVGLSRATLIAVWRSQAFVEASAGAAIIMFLMIGTLLILRRRAYNLRVAERLQHIERTETLGRITSTVAHDFNNLLAAIGGNLELLDIRLPEGDRSRKQLSTALCGIERGGRMVGQLLAFARQQNAEPTVENVCESVLSGAELLCQAARPCELHIDTPEEPLFSVLYPGDFDRMLMNLIVNARDASKHGGSINLSIRKENIAALQRKKWPDLTPGDYIACRITDWGQGIPPDVLRRVFEPFFTTKSDKGTGLGLSQVMAFARRSGGGAFIESAKGVGTCVTVMLPCAEPALGRRGPTDPGNPTRESSGYA